MRVAPPVIIDKSQREILQQWARSRSLPAPRKRFLQFNLAGLVKDAPAKATDISEK